MSQKYLVIWFSVASVIGMLVGILFAFFGLGVLPVSKDVLIPWGNGVYGSTLIGFCVALFFVGRHAFRRNDPELMKALLYGIYTWLIIEALFSLYYRVFFNVAVDILLTVVLGFPLIKGMKQDKP